MKRSATQSTNTLGAIARRGAILVLMIAGITALASTASAQSLTLTSSAITAGGGTSSGNTYAMTGTPSQSKPMNMKASGNRFTVAGGFPIVTLLQTPGAPRLSVTVEGGNVTISWPESFTGWTLEQTGNLATMASWQNTTGVSNNSVTFAMPSGRTFFRLQKTTE